jgi:hypothetical protein
MPNRGFTVHKYIAWSAMLSLTMVSTVSAAPSTSLPVSATPDQQLARAILKELVEINTTHQHGSTEAA